MNIHTQYLIYPLLSLVTGYILAVVSITRGKLKSENIMLSMICVWWTLLSWPFIWHNIDNDPEIMIKVERTVHTFYVFMPAISLMFFQTIIGQKGRFILPVVFLMSSIFALFVQTDLYFSEFYYYSWGMIAKGGIAFKIFSYYGISITLYIFFLFIRKIRVEKNKILRLKINYLFLSYFLSALLTMTNIPAMNGFDFYPLSNFIFVPLGIMTYGILKYRLIDIGSAVHVAIFWLILSSLIIIPNIIIFVQVTAMISRLNNFILILVFILWFTANYFYFNRIQPLINRLLNRKNYNIKQMEKTFIRDLALLKNLDDLIYEVTLLLRKTLELNHVSLYLQGRESSLFSNADGEIIELDDITTHMLARFDDVYLQKSILESGISNGSAFLKIIAIMEEQKSEYLVPLVNQENLISLIFLSEKKDSRQFNDSEFRFIRNISAYSSIALANSVMYKNISDIKDNLELIVEERTSIIEKQKLELETDMQFARKIQMSLLPKNIPVIKNLNIAFKYEPILGVGGDFIDIHYREGMNDVGLFICDVSGHGASSAMIASMVKMSLNSWGKFIQKPGDAFVEMRKLLSGKIGDNFISAFMCSINLKTGEVISACAGHPPMIIIRKNGDADEIKPHGRIITDAADSPYEESRIILTPGDRIVLYTDGVIEARASSGEMIGQEKFISMLKKYSAFPPQELCGRIYNEIFNGSNEIAIDDDFALLIAEFS